MTSRFLATTTLAIAAVIILPLSHAQQNNAQPSTKPFPHKVLYFHPPKPTMTPEAHALVKSQAAAAQTIPLWDYSTVAQDGGTYTGMMVGRSPFAHGHRTRSPLIWFR